MPASTYLPAICQPRRSQCSRNSRTCISGDWPLREAVSKSRTILQQLVPRNAMPDHWLEPRGYRLRMVLARTSDKRHSRPG
jgi:hypothetical protein